MLTRRDQLKLKQDQDVEKKNGKNGNPEKTGEMPKAKAKSKGAGRGKGKTKKGQGNQQQTQEDGDVSPFKTPKRKLFEDGGDYGENLGDENDPVMKAQKAMEDPATKMVVDPKTGEQRSLAAMFEEYLPTAWKNKMKSSRDPRNAVVGTGVSEQKEDKQKPKARANAAGRAKAKASPKPKAKGKAKAKAKLNSSPSVKKEQARRRKKQEEELKDQQPENMLDELLVDVFKQHIKKTEPDTFTDDDFKTYFRDYFKTYKGMFTFSCYWDKQAVGLVFSGGSHFAYFSFCNKRAPWKFNMTLACVCAYMMVSFKHLCIFISQPV